jgi:hypothetical protein
MDHGPLLILFYSLIVLQFIGFDTMIYNLASASTEEEADITQKDVIDWIVTILTASIASTIAAVALWYNAKTTKQSHKLTQASLDLNTKSLELDANSRYVEFLRDTSKELTDLEQNTNRILSPNNKKNRKNWESKYLNAVDRIALLVNKGRIPEDLVDHYRQSFAYARYVIENSDNRKDREQTFSDTIHICKKRSWEPLDLEIRTAN